MMRRLYVLLLILISIVFTNQSINAHPGRQDSNGGHVCRTNCEKWGLEYGEYHYHNYTNNSTSTKNVQNNEKYNHIPNWIIWSVIILGVAIYLIIKFNIRLKNENVNNRTIIDVTPKTISHTIKLPQPPTEVSLEGIITTTIYRNRPFFVARFVSNDGENHIIVGSYNYRLYTNKQYRIDGIKHHDNRYGEQIKVKNISRL